MKATIILYSSKKFSFYISLKSHIIKKKKTQSKIGSIYQYLSKTWIFWVTWPNQNLNFSADHAPSQYLLTFFFSLCWYIKTPLHIKIHNPRNWPFCRFISSPITKSVHLFFFNLPPLSPPPSKVLIFHCSW